MEDTLKTKKGFLKLYYPDIYKKHGNKVLAKKLQSILIKHIKKTFPVLHKNLQDTKTRLENELKTLQTPDSKISFSFIKRCMQIIFRYDNGKQKRCFR